MRLQHRCILVNIAEFLRTAISKNICEQLLVCGGGGGGGGGVCVCVFILFYREGFFRLQDVWDILERYGSTMLCWVLFQVLLLNYFISVSKNVINIASKDEDSSEHKLEKKRYDIWFRKKMIYIDIGHKSAVQQTDKCRRDTKDEEATLI